MACLFGWQLLVLTEKCLCADRSTIFAFISEYFNVWILVFYLFFLFPLLFEVYDSNNSIWKPISISNNFDLFMLFFEEVWRGLKVVIILPRQIALIGFLDRFEIVFSICYSSLQQTWQSFLLFLIFLLQKRQMWGRKVKLL